MPYLLRMAWFLSKLAPLEQFPAQLHINLLPEARGLGLGAALMERYLGCLEAQHIKGAQLSTTRENAAAVRLYEKFGFEVSIAFPTITTLAVARNVLTTAKNRRSEYSWETL